MISLAKSRDPRLARQQAQLAAQMAAASTNSTSTTAAVVGAAQVPSQPTAMDPSGKPLSIRERLGRIPKRVDPRLKAQGSGGDADRKKVSSTTTINSSSSSTATSHKSRSDSDVVTKKRERKDESAKSGKSSSTKSSQMLDKKKYFPSDSSPPKSSSSPVKKKSISFEKLSSRSEKSLKQREGKSSKSGKRRSDETSKSPENSSVSSTSSSEHLMGVANESKDVDLRLLMPEKKLRLDSPQLPPKQQSVIVSKPLTEQSKSQHHLLPSLSSLSSSVLRKYITVLLRNSQIIFFYAEVVLPKVMISRSDQRTLHLLSERAPPKVNYHINGCLNDNRAISTTSQHKTTRELNYLICCQIKKSLMSETPRRAFGSTCSFSFHFLLRFLVNFLFDSWMNLAIPGV